MAILFYFLLFILPKLFLVSSSTLDIHYPDYNGLEQYHKQYSYISPYINNLNRFQSTYRRPYQCPYSSSLESVYYPSPNSRCSSKPIEKPLIIPPSLLFFWPKVNFSSAQFVPSTQIIQDENKYKSEDFTRKQTQNQKNPVKLGSQVESTTNVIEHESKGYSNLFTQTPQMQSGLASNFQKTEDETGYKTDNDVMSHPETQKNEEINKRHLLQPYPTIYQSPIYYQSHPYQYRYMKSFLSTRSPILKVRNTNNNIRMDSNHRTRSIFSRRGDSRSDMEPSKIQNGNDVATQSSINKLKNSPTS